MLIGTGKATRGQQRLGCQQPLAALGFAYKKRWVEKRVQRWTGVCAQIYMWGSVCAFVVCMGSVHACHVLCLPSSFPVHEPSLFGAEAGFP